MKRLFDVIVSVVALVALSPVFLVAMIGIRLSSRGPVFYLAKRAGRNARPFLMHKFRTMRLHGSMAGSAITACQDSRVFPFGSLLRKLKVDELPQFYDVLRGEMSIVGPRPEDAKLVEHHYSGQDWETLAVRPGLASPGSIYNYTHGERLIGREDPEKDYLEKLLPVKLALELVYVRDANFLYDLRVMFRTLWVILMIALGRRQFPDPHEMVKARQYLAERATRKQVHLALEYDQMTRADVAVVAAIRQCVADGI